jgi:hypothetical protein
MYISLLTTLGVALQLGLATAQTKVTVNSGTTYQVIDGFGFSEAFGFGSGVENAPATQQTQALNYMFSIYACSTRGDYLWSIAIVDSRTRRNMRKPKKFAPLSLVPSVTLV